MSCCAGTEGMRGSGPHVVLLGDCREEGGSPRFGASVARCGHGFERRFESREERATALEAYLKELDEEAVAVREALADLKA